MKKSILFLLSIITITVINVNAQVSVNTTGTSPDPQSMLDVSSPDKGILIPRIALNSDVDPIIPPIPIGLTVYNFGGVIGSDGFYYWDGVLWNRISDMFTPASATDIIIDQDGDTYVTVEQTYDDDNVRFYIAGIQKWRMTSQNLEPVNSGNSVLIGYQAGTNTTSGQFNTATGDYSLVMNSTGWGNTSNGYYSLNANTTGHQNVAAGITALKLNTEGMANTAIGAGAMNKNETGYSNVAIGTMSLFTSTDRNNMVAVGDSSLL